MGSIPTSPARLQLRTESSSQDGPAGWAPKVSVVIPCRNEYYQIASCLEHLLALSPPPGGFEVIVADGQSDDGTRELLASLEKEHNKRRSGANGEGVHIPSLRVIDNPRLTTPFALNAAIRSAQGDIIVRVDVHSEYAPDYLLRCLEALQQTGADNVGGPARTKADGYLQRAIAAAYHSAFAVGGARFHDPGYEGCVDTVTYGCWPRSTFEKFGLFDEELARNQDDEHNLRITRGGGKVYQSPAIRSWYRPRASLGELIRQYSQYGYWKVLVIQKHKRPASLRHLIPAAFLLTLLLLGLGSLAFGPARWAFASLIGLYSLCLLAASAQAARRNGWALLPVLPLVFCCYHFGYGYGFLHGVWDCVICRRTPQVRFQHLTR